MQICITLGQPLLGEKKLYQKERYEQMVSCLDFPLVDCPCHVWHYSYVISTTQLFQFVVINNAFVLWSRPTGFDQRVTILYIHSFTNVQLLVLQSLHQPYPHITILNIKQTLWYQISANGLNFQPVKIKLK